MGGFPGELHIPPALSKLTTSTPDVIFRRGKNIYYTKLLLPLRHALLTHTIARLISNALSNIRKSRRVTPDEHVLDCEEFVLQKQYRLLQLQKEKSCKSMLDLLQAVKAPYLCDSNTWYDQFYPK